MTIVATLSLMQKTCKNTWCKQPFEITDSDLQFYEEISPVYAGKKELIPSPTLCPECRMQRRLAWRNERFLYRKPDANTGEIIFSAFPSESEIKTNDLIIYGIVGILASYSHYFGVALVFFQLIYLNFGKLFFIYIYILKI